MYLSTIYILNIHLLGWLLSELFFSIKTSLDLRIFQSNMRFPWETAEQIFVLKSALYVHQHFYNTTFFLRERNKPIIILNVNCSSDIHHRNSFYFSIYRLFILHFYVVENWVTRKSYESVSFIFHKMQLNSAVCVFSFWQRLRWERKREIFFLHIYLTVTELCLPVSSISIFLVILVDMK